MGANKKDGVIMGAIAGLLLFYPKISEWVSANVTPLIPSNMLFLGDFTVPVIGILIGMLAGYMIEKS